jgi:hypothetical protein
MKLLSAHLLYTLIEVAEFAETSPILEISIIKKEVPGITNHLLSFYYILSIVQSFFTVI